jgi:hypothetical protein
MIDAAESRIALLRLMHPGVVAVNDPMAREVTRCSCPARGTGGHTSRSNRGYKYNIASVCKYETIEFRQAQGTKDAKWIGDWVTRTLRFVTEAIGTSDRSFAGWAKHETLADEVYRCFGIMSPEPEDDTAETPSFELLGTESISGESSVGSTTADSTPSS